MSTREVQVAGLDCLRVAVELLRRVRQAGPTAGVWDAADVQWWWRRPRMSDDVTQTFVLDDDGPVACALTTEWDGTWQLDPIVVPGGEDCVPRILDLGLAVCDHAGAPRIDTLVSDDSSDLAALLVRAGFEKTDHTGTTGWTDADGLASGRPLPSGYRVVDRATNADGPHWLAARSGEYVEARLGQTPTYDPSLDLAVVTDAGDVAAYSLLWFDPVTLVGMIEPMRTEDEHQRRGLGEAMLGVGLRRLVDRGAKRLKVGWVTAAAGALYTGLGFRPASTDTCYRLTR